MRMRVALVLTALAVTAGIATSMPAEAAKRCTPRPAAACAGARLVGADLHGRDLRRADFRRADLRRANLRKADLRGADLRNADLRQADLRGARLQGARTAGARLTGAKLDGNASPGASTGTGATGATSGNGSGASAPGGSGLPEPLTLILPYADAAQIERIGPKVTQSAAGTAGAPPAFHNGVDFVTLVDGVAFRAMSDGVVVRAELFAGTNQQVNVLVDVGGGYTMVYGFEPMSPSDGARQLAAIAVAAGQRIAAGDVIGTLIKVGSGAHLHVHMQRSDGTGEPICFPDRWSVADRAAATLKLGGGYTQLCYG